MKRLSCFMNNQHGFILPFTLFISAIVLLIIITNITIYDRDVHTTHKYIEHIKLQTLFQMGREKFKHEFNDLDLNENKVVYSLPDGKVEIEYVVFEAEYSLYFTIYTKDNSVYKGVNMFKVPSDGK